MIELWIIFTIAAAFCQNMRSALQKHLTATLSTAGAAYVRFFYAWPFAVLYCLIIKDYTGLPWPEVSLEFLMWCLLGGVAQIVFTFLLVWMFSFRNFAVGTTFSKTEVFQVAILGYLLLGDTVTIWAAVAIALSLVGVVILTLNKSRLTFSSLISGLTEKPTLIGLASGAFLGASVVFYRGATLSLGGEGFLMQAAFSLTVAVLMQTVIMGAYLIIREKGQLTQVVINWRTALPVGLVGVLASIFWFSSFVLQNAAYVRALGQIELVFTFIASIFFFKEKTTRLEIIGIGLIIIAIIILALYG